MRQEEIRKAVRDRYGNIAKRAGSCCQPAMSTGCGCGPSAETISIDIGYSPEDLKAVPDGANLGLGCGNPVALAGLKEGETVIDLGSGAGFDCFLAAKAVGAKGRVIGIDMTPEMLDQARANAQKGRYETVEFRLGEIENLPVADNTADIVISNCVINLSPDKDRVFRETFRVLKPGGRLMVSDIVLLESLPDSIRKSLDAYIGCVAGASLKTDYLKCIADAGFVDVSIVGESMFPLEDFFTEIVPKTDSLNVVSLKVSAKKPI